MKKIISLVLILIFIFPQTVFANENEVNKYPEYYIPVLNVAENNNCKIKINNKEIIITHEKINYLFSVKNNTVTVNNNTKKLSNPIKDINHEFYMHYDDLSFIYGNKNDTYKNTKKEIVYLAYSYLYTHDIPGITLTLVDEERNYTWTQGFGYSNIENHEPVTKDTIFSLGSISKTFTALGILKLEEQGKINLDKKIVDYIPTFKLKSNPTINNFYNSSENITIKMLLSHYSGIPEDLYNGFLTKKNHSKIYLNNIIENLSGVYLKSIPGTRFSYSNTGYGVLGGIISATQNNLDYFQGFNNYMLENIFLPLNMTSSFFEVENDYKYNLSASYKSDSKKQNEDNYINNLPAASLYSTAEDMSKFLTLMIRKGNFNTKDIFKKDSIEKIITPVDFKDNLNNISYGLGTKIYNIGEREYIGHSGDLEFFKSDYKISFPNKIGVFVSGNSSNSKLAVEEISSSLIENAIDEKTNNQNNFTNNKIKQEFKYLEFNQLEKFLGTYLNIGLIKANNNSEINLVELGMILKQQINGGFKLDNDTSIFYFEIIDEIHILKIIDEQGNINSFQKIDIREESRFLSWTGNYIVDNKIENEILIFKYIKLDLINDYPVIELYPSSQSEPNKLYLRKIDNNKYYILGIGEGVGNIIEKVEIDNKIYIKYNGLILKKV